MNIMNMFQRLLKRRNLRAQISLSHSTFDQRRTGHRTSLEQLEDRSLMAGDLMAAASTVRSYDGTGNNLAHPQWASTDEVLLRIAPAEYGNLISTPAGADRPSARTISNTLADHPAEDVKNDRSLAAMVYAWGQFIDHDLDLTVTGTPTEKFNITVPTGDPEFDPFNTGTQVIGLSRSQYDPTTGTSAANPRQQLNTITSYLDGSMIYGSDATRAAALRTFSGGLLKTSTGNLLPLNTAGLANDNATHQTADSQLFLAGDVRANENIELTALQTLFVREHNRLATQIAKANPKWTDEQIFQQARKLVIGEIQAITYNEFLASLLGSAAPGVYKGYNPNVNAAISNEFSTAAFRVGHTMLGNDIEFLANDESEVHEAVALSEAFFNPNLLKETGIDPVLKYLATDLAEEIDPLVVDSVRNFLFGPPGSGGLDLVSLNIQRGRDHGLANYNATRVKFGLKAITSFADITSDVDVQAKLKQLYGTVDNIDLWVGGLAEDHLPDSSVGPTFARIIGDQFERLRAGDRFWYQNDLKGTDLELVSDTSLADVIRRNTTVTNLQENVFRYGSEISGRLVSDLNRDNKPQSAEPGLANRVVQLVAADNSVVAVTTTNAQGNYSFYGIENGTYKVREVLPVGAARAAVTSASIAITQRSTFDNVALAIPIPVATTPTTPPKPSGPTQPSGPTKPNSPPPPARPQQPPPRSLTAAEVGMSQTATASSTTAAPKPTAPPPIAAAPASANKPAAAPQVPTIPAGVFGVSSATVKPAAAPVALPQLLPTLLKPASKLG
jgi:peroxidase